MNKKDTMKVGLVIAIIAIAGFALAINNAKQNDADNTSTNPVRTVPAPGSNAEEISTGVDAIDSVTTTSDKIEVTYTRDGFSPRISTIKAGAEVTFYNKSGEPMWVASNPHPVHSDYSTFDQLQIGDSYTFIFKEPGTYNYHNHLSPRIGGKIIVK